MDAEELPDDPKRWPDDPFAVLGVARGAADADIKRAYNRLLRRFKPEQFPEQFQKLRESYESCLTQSPWYRREPGDESAPEPMIIQSSEPMPEDRATGFWQAAIEGRLPEAYTGLFEMHRSEPERRDLPLRLYWLLTVAPELDSHRTRHEWLFAALQSSRLSGPSVELYRRELEANPTAALEGVYDRLLAIPCESSDLQSLAGKRIAAAARASAGKRLLEDLQILQHRRAEIGDVAWLSLITSVIVWTMWDDWPMIREFTRDELATLQYLELPQSHYFDRIEEARAVAKPRKFLARSELVALIPLLRVQFAAYDSPTDAEIESAAFAISADLERLLVSMDSLTREYGPEVLLRVARIFMTYLEAQDRADREEFPPDIIRAVARRLGKMLLVNQYQFRRPEVIAALAEEGIEPGEFASALLNDERYLQRDYAGFMKDDLAFRVGWLSLRIVRG